MSKFLKWMGWTAFGLTIVFILLVIGWTLSIGIHLDSSSKAWVDEKMPALFSLADKNSKGMPPELARIYNPALVNNFLTQASGLGRFNKYSGSSGEATVTITLGKPIITATYSVKAEFEKGSVNVAVVLIRQSGIWIFKSIQIKPQIIVN